MTHLFLAAAQLTVPNTPEWSPTVGIVMVVFNILGLIIANAGVQNKGAGPAVPIPGFSNKFGLPELLAGTCFGHILGAGAILGLSNSGLL